MLFFGAIITLGADDPSGNAQPISGAYYMRLAQWWGEA